MGAKSYVSGQCRSIWVGKSRESLAGEQPSMLIVQINGSMTTADVHDAWKCHIGTIAPGISMEAFKQHCRMRLMPFANKQSSA